MKEEFRPAVIGILVNKQGQVLIGSSVRDGGYKFPQGGLDEGESPREGLKRELKEELGLVIDEADIVEMYDEKVRYYFPGKSNPNHHYVGQEFVVFKIVYKEDKPLIPNDEEFETLVWIDPKELENYDTRHRIDGYRRALELCGLLVGYQSFYAF